MLFQPIVNVIRELKQTVVHGFETIERLLTRAPEQTWTTRFPLEERVEWAPADGKIVAIHRVSVDVVDGRYEVQIEVDPFRIVLNAHAFRHSPVDLDLIVTRAHPLVISVRRIAGEPARDSDAGSVSLVLRGRALPSFSDTVASAPWRRF